MEEREFMRMEREWKKIGPQADGVGEQQLPAIGQQLKEIGPQADGGRMIDAWWLIIDYSQKRGEKFGGLGNNTYLCGVN